jgi:hypothetical protein
MAAAPRARTTGLLIEELEDELLVYDLAADRAHRLNGTAATVFRHADGTRSVAELVDVLTEKVGGIADEDLVLITLDGLVEAGLVEDYKPRPTKDTRTSRRKFIARAGAIGAAATVLPIVHSIIAPTVAQAQTPPCDGPECYYYYAYYYYFYYYYRPADAAELRQRFRERRAQRKAR